MEKFKAAVLTEQKKPLEIWEVKNRSVEGYEVAVKLITSCICGAQVNEFLGKKKVLINFYHILWVMRDMVL